MMLGKSSPVLSTLAVPRYRSATSLSRPRVAVGSLFDHVAQHAKGLQDRFGVPGIDPKTGKEFDLFSLLSVPFDTAGTPIYFGEYLEKLFDLGQQTADGIENEVKKALKAFFDQTGNILKQPLHDFVDYLKGEWQLVYDALVVPFENLVKHLFDVANGILQELIEILVKLVVGICKTIVDDVKDVLDVTKSIITDFYDAIEKLWRVILGFLCKELNVLDNLPSPIRCGLTDSFNAVIALGDLLTSSASFHATVSLTGRAQAVLSSLKALGLLIVDAAGPKSAGAVEGFLEALFTAFVEVIQMALTAGAKFEACIQKLIDVFVGADGLLLGVFKAIATQRLWFWLDFPCGLKSGHVQAWINSDAQYAKDTVNIDIQRQYRIRLMAAVDSLLRARIDDPKLPSILAGADTSAIARVASDFLCVFFDTTIFFILEPDCFPFLDADLDVFEDVGIKYAGVMGGQIRGNVRAMVSLLLRGVWLYSIENEVLIEMIASTIGSIISGIYAGVIRHLTWTFKIVSRYPGSSVGGSTIVGTWPSMEIVLGTPSTFRLEYVALLRSGDDLPAGFPLGSALLDGMMADMAAYLDMSYQRYRLENRFPQIETADIVTITRADIVNNALIVWATSSDARDLPQPILRVYCCCEIQVMKPGGDLSGATPEYNPADPYTLELPMSRIPRCLDLTVLSSRGGVAKKRIIRA